MKYTYNKQYLFPCKENTIDKWRVTSTDPVFYVLFIAPTNLPLVSWWQRVKQSSPVYMLKKPVTTIIVPKMIRLYVSASTLSCKDMREHLIGTNDRSSTSGKLGSSNMFNTWLMYWENHLNSLMVLFYLNTYLTCWGSRMQCCVFVFTSRQAQLLSWYRRIESPIQANVGAQ